MTPCLCKIRPFPNETELQCEEDEPGHERHSAVLRDYAYPGSKTTLSWLDGDRRNFIGEWHRCPHLPSGGQCTLPKDHHGRCAA